MDDPSSTADPTFIPIDPALGNSAFDSSFAVDGQSANYTLEQTSTISPAMGGRRSGNRQPTNNPDNQFFCDWVYDDNQPCGLDFPKQHELTKHYRNHTKPVRCLVADCSHGSAEKKDMHRHMWTNHPSEAEMLGIPGTRIHCPASECPYNTKRPDNMKRHRETMDH
ncbi:hypothetical protein B0T14DRAFT_571912 [Immersiella caudata]|uniref:C2H2-type domain-containing protein n=1 Tax=Immersiella caudata TaxID=314043 RepID=A0AA39TTJ0_9PEZI|nr:hypothetical protein B0T14DRAFT_571912 [Immersiella caudata]